VDCVQRATSRWLSSICSLKEPTLHDTAGDRGGANRSGQVDRNDTGSGGLRALNGRRLWRCDDGLGQGCASRDRVCASAERGGEPGTQTAGGLGERSAATRPYAQPPGGRPLALDGVCNWPSRRLVELGADPGLHEATQGPTAQLRVRPSPHRSTASGPTRDPSRAVRPRPPGRHDRSLRWPSGGRNWWSPTASPSDW
jgi:hypothetical protein